MTDALPWFSTSEEVAFKTCRLGHHFDYDLGYGPVVTNRKLSTGIGLHVGLEAHYKGEDWKAAVAEWADKRWAEIEAAGDQDLAEVRVNFIQDRGLVTVMVQGYIEWVRDEHLDDHYTTVSVEEALLIEVPGAPCLLPVKLDLLQRNNATGRLRIVDFKTRASFSSDTTAYQLAEQNGNYALAVFAHYGERPTEMAYRECRKVIPSGRSKPPYFREVRVRLTPEELARRAEQYVATAAERFNPDRAIYANPGACCGSWKNDWQAPCLKVSQGYTPIEALEQSSRYAPKDAYARYQEDTEE